MICASRVISFVGLLALAFSLPLFKREEPTPLWVPPTITYPNKWTVWCIGNSHHVYWDATNQITDLYGSIYLISATRLLRLPDQPLATNFPLDAGVVTITVPQVPPDKYAVDLNGTGNGETEGWSQFFKIDAC